MSRLDELEQAARAATPGNWWVSRHVVSNGRDALLIGCESRDERDVPLFVAGLSDDDGSAADANFIARSDPDTVLALIALVKELENALGELDDAMTVYTDTEPLPRTQADIVEAHADAQTPLGIARLHAQRALASVSTWETT